MDINVNGKFKPAISLIAILSIILILPLLNSSQDIEGSLDQLNELGNSSLTRMIMLISQAVASIFLFIILPFVWLKISNVKVRETFFHNTRYDLSSFICFNLFLNAVLFL